MLNYILILHLLGATIWTGGHLVLAIAVLPKVLKNKDINSLMSFEQTFEKIGMPALVLQVITGLWMAYKMLPDIGLWFVHDNDLSILITTKLVLLLLTILVAMHARFRVIPNLSASTLNLFAVHIITVTLISVIFVIVGTLFRSGLPTF